MKDILPIIFDSVVSEAYDYDMVMRAIDNKKMDKPLLVDPETGELTDDPKPYFGWSVVAYLNKTPIKNWGFVLKKEKGDKNFNIFSSSINKF